MPWEFGTASDKGGRQEQQDRVDILSTTDGHAHLIVVADGMGGHHAGALAAQTLVDVCARRFREGAGSDPLELLGTLCLEAHEAINMLGEHSDRSPGSTCVLLYVIDDQAHWVHVGDSRLYHFRHDGLLNRTIDHSMTQLLITQGSMTELEASTSDLKNQIFMRLGGSEAPDPEFGTADVVGGDLFMLCSDGLWEHVDPDEAKQGLREGNLNDGARDLVRLARTRGGDSGDNISVALARWNGPPGGMIRNLLGAVWGRGG